MHHFEICQMCTLPMRSGIRLTCNHIYCQDCHLQLERTVQSSLGIVCPICLKSSRESLPNFNLTRNLARSTSSRAGSIIPNRGPKQKLYCFVCHQTLSISDFMNGGHQKHRVKTYQQAVDQLQVMHLRSLKILQSKMEDLVRKQASMHTHLDHTFSRYKHMQDQINTYFDKLAVTVEQQRQTQIRQLEQIYNANTDRVVREVQDIKEYIKGTRLVGGVLKGFCENRVGIDDLLKKTVSLKEHLQFKVYKVSLPDLPKIIESFDVSFHIKNSISFVWQSELQKQQPSMSTTKSEIDLDTLPAPGLPRKVRLLQKVRNQMNPSCKFLRDDIFLFQF